MEHATDTMSHDRSSRISEDDRDPRKRSCVSEPEYLRRYPQERESPSRRRPCREHERFTCVDGIHVISFCDHRDQSVRETCGEDSFGTCDEKFRHHFQTRNSSGWSHSNKACRNILPIILLIVALPTFAVGGGDILPLWSAGDNSYGALGVTRNAGTSIPNEVPMPISSSLWPAAEVVSVHSYWRHTLIQTANKTDISVDAIKAFQNDTSTPVSLQRDTYRFGWNYYGQLGPSDTVGSNTALAPSRLPRALFSSNVAGNEVTSSTNTFDYSVWIEGAPASFSCTVAPGHIDAATVAAAANVCSLQNGHDGAWIAATTDATGSRNAFRILKAGYQIQLGTVAPTLGYPANTNIPENGLAGEISERMGNNRLVYLLALNQTLATWNESVLIFPDGIYATTADVRACVCVRGLVLCMYVCMHACM
jgi:hypothetical protein